jgi:hypothetical protein
LNRVVTLILQLVSRLPSSTLVTSATVVGKFSWV